MQKNSEFFDESDLAAPDTLSPLNAYGNAKRAAEQMCTIFGKNYGIEIVIARCFAFVGPDLPMNANYAIGNFIHDALNEDFIAVKGDGLAVRSYMDQEDLAIWLWRLLQYGKAGEAYNVGSDQAITIKLILFNG